MGIYSNYAMVVSTVSRVVYNVLQSITGTIGNLMVQEDSEHKNKVFEEFTFVTFCFYFFISAGFSACIERFIVIWAGDDWLLSPVVTFMVILNFFLMGMRQPCIVVIEAAGLFNKMRLKAVGEVIVNLVVSFIFLIVFEMGIYGVLLGTTVSMVSICIWWEIMAVHKYSLYTSARKYTADFIGYIIVAAVGCFASCFASKLMPVDGIPGLILAGIAATVIFGITVLAVYSRSRRFKALLGRFSKKGAKK
jgi:O-antigen/teichoic acid export membrane protein